MIIRRDWGMPTPDTFQCPPIGAFVDSYLKNSNISVDVFSRNFSGATYTNDINPDTSADYHLHSIEFLEFMKSKQIQCDLIIFDPPYSLEQYKRSYDKFGYEETLNGIRWTNEKNIIDELLEPGGYFLNFGWHTNGMGKTRGYSIKEILLVAHGGAHNDTICMAEQKNGKQLKLF